MITAEDALLDKFPHMTIVAKDRLRSGLTSQPMS